MPDGLKHTSAAELEAFMSKSQSAQLVEIWLNCRETNGSVADAQMKIAEMGLEIQKARIDLSQHAEIHLSPLETMELKESGSIGKPITDARMTMYRRVNTMWQWFTVGRVIAVIVVALQPLEVAGFVWFINK